MMRHVLARKLVLYVAYSALVTALPVLASVPAAKVVLPVFRSTSCQLVARPCDGGRCLMPLPAQPNIDVREVEPAAAEVVACDRPPVDRSRFWCRGPVRRGVRAVALFVSRPWRR